MLTDSHAHLEMSEFDEDREQVLERALEGEVTRIITVGTDPASSVESVKLAQAHDFIHATIGCHPHNAKDCSEDDLERLCKLASKPKVVAWGEIGLDFFKLYSPRQRQLALFDQQLDLACRYDLPVVIHDRDAHHEVLSILQRKKQSALRGVIHCYSGDFSMAREFIALGFTISIPGTVTYKKAKDTQETAAKIPLESLLVETDAPYLAPVPMRGKRNEPLFVTHTARAIAELRGMDFQEFCHATYENTSRIFGL